MDNEVQIATATSGGCAYTRRIVRQAVNRSEVNVILLYGKYQDKVATAITKQIKELRTIGAKINYTLHLQNISGDIYEYDTDQIRY